MVHSAKSKEADGTTGPSADGDDGDSRLQSLIDDASDTFDEDGSRSFSKSDLDEGEGALSDELNTTTTSPKAQQH